MKFAIVFALFIACASAGWTGPIAQVASPSWSHQAAPLAYASHYNNYDNHYDGRWDGVWDHQGNWANGAHYNTWNAAPLAYSAWNHAPAVAYAAPAHAYSAPAYAAIHPAPAHAATYKAATLGATHVAPLIGHTVSRTNLNLAAPPTY